MRHGRQADPTSARQRVIAYINEFVETAGRLPAEGEIMTALPDITRKSANAARWQHGRELGLIGGDR